jgi:hypothetical protein
LHPPVGESCNACGDGICESGDNGEDCISCPEDCGDCPPVI